VLIKLKETDALFWEKTAESFLSRSPGTLQMRYYTKLKVRELVPKKRRRKERKTQLVVRDFGRDDGEITLCMGYPLPSTVSYSLSAYRWISSACSYLP
jgi:hypothetical protein